MHVTRITDRVFVYLSMFCPSGTYVAHGSLHEPSPETPMQIKPFYAKSIVFVHDDGLTYDATPFQIFQGLDGQAKIRLGNNILSFTPSGDYAGTHSRFEDALAENPEREQAVRDAIAQSESDLGVAPTTFFYDFPSPECLDAARQAGVTYDGHPPPERPKAKKPRLPAARRRKPTTAARPPVAKGKPAKGAKKRLGLFACEPAAIGERPEAVDGLAEAVGGVTRVVPQEPVEDPEEGAAGAPPAGVEGSVTPAACTTVSTAA